MLYIINEVTLNGYKEINLDLLYIIAILLGILVIISKNPENIYIGINYQIPGTP